jgi:hypothetical protein
MPERGPDGFAGDLLAVGWQVAAAVAVPLFAAAWVSQQVTQDTSVQLLIVLAGLAVAGIGMYEVITRYLARNPVPPTSEAARDAGLRWEREIEERTRQKEAGEDVE